jgi:CDP-diacylglycerol--serine O-phosphatidyltransferase
MRLRSVPAAPAARRRRLETIRVLPTVVTACNLLAGVLAISYLLDGAALGVAEREGLIRKAAWLVFLGMFCDAMDGRLARLTRTTSTFGAQLDSLADVVTFGVAPALIVKSVLSLAYPGVPARLAFAVCVVYVVGAGLRLARYNAEGASAPADRPHVTRIFRGLPSPAAAGVVASLVLLHGEQRVSWADAGWLSGLLFAVTPVLGLLMISRMPYSHLLNRYVEGRRALPSVLMLLAAAFLAVAYFEWTVAGIFAFYALTGPAVTLFERLSGWPEWVEREEEDEEVLGDEGDEDDGEAGGDEHDGEAGDDEVPDAPGRPAPGGGEATGRQGLS